MICGILFTWLSIQLKTDNLMLTSWTNFQAKALQAGFLFWKKNSSGSLLNTTIYLLQVLTNCHGSTSRLLSKTSYVWKDLLVLLTVRNRPATKPVMLKVHNVKLSFDIWLVLYMYFILYFQQYPPFKACGSHMEVIWIAAFKSYTTCHSLKALTVLWGF